MSTPPMTATPSELARLVPCKRDVSREDTPYPGRTPGPRDAVQVVEVADSSYAIDRRTNSAVDPAARIPVLALLP